MANLWALTHPIHFPPSLQQTNQQYFVTESALYELAKYGIMYSAEVAAALNEDGLTDTVQTFQDVVKGLNPQHN